MNLFISYKLFDYKNSVKLIEMEYGVKKKNVLYNNNMKINSDHDDEKSIGNSNYSILKCE